MQLDKTTIFPQPDAAALAHSQTLQAVIQHEIDCEGPISFARFMEMALYTPGLGYYTAGSEKIGEAGDFVTAPEISALFSMCLANQCAEVLNVTGGDILEFGAGTGKMAAALLQRLDRLGGLPDTYYIVEVSADLKERQYRYFQKTIPHLADKIKWLQQLPEHINGVILANEVVDAFPVHRFKKLQGKIQEIFVTYDQDQFQCVLQSPTPALQNCLAMLPSLAEGYESEYNTYLAGWITTLDTVLARGVVFIIDYGFPRHEFYHPDRHLGTLMCHYRHRSHHDPFAFIGLQDITSHVDFSSVLEAAQAANFLLAGYTNQASFLLSCGMIDLFSNTLSDEQHLKLAAQAKVLTSPSEMGELFKVMALAKQFDHALMGFKLRDYSERL